MEPPAGAGTLVVDQYRDTWWMRTAGKTSLSLGSNMASIFSSLPKPDYELGVIAGVTEDTMFSKMIPGDNG